MSTNSMDEDVEHIHILQLDGCTSTSLDGCVSTGTDWCASIGPWWTLWMHFHCPLLMDVHPLPPWWCISTVPRTYMEINKWMICGVKEYYCCDFGNNKNNIFYWSYLFIPPFGCSHIYFSIGRQNEFKWSFKSLHGTVCMCAIIKLNICIESVHS